MRNIKKRIGILFIIFLIGITGCDLMKATSEDSPPTGTNNSKEDSSSEVTNSDSPEKETSSPKVTNNTPKEETEEVKGEAPPEESLVFAEKEAPSLEVSNDLNLPKEESLTPAEEEAVEVVPTAERFPIEDEEAEKQRKIKEKDEKLKRDWDPLTSFKSKLSFWNSLPDGMRESLRRVLPPEEFEDFLKYKEDTERKEREAKRKAERKAKHTKSWNSFDRDYKVSLYKGDSSHPHIDLSFLTQDDIDEIETHIKAKEAERLRIETERLEREAKRKAERQKAYHWDPLTLSEKADLWESGYYWPEFRIAISQEEIDEVEAFIDKRNRKEKEN